MAQQDGDGCYGHSSQQLLTITAAPFSLHISPAPAFSPLAAILQYKSSLLWGPQQAAAHISALVWFSPLAVEQNLLYHSLFHRLKENLHSCASFSFFSDLGVHSIVSTFPICKLHIGSFLLSQKLHVAFKIYIPVALDHSCTAPPIKDKERSKKA